MLAVFSSAAPRLNKAIVEQISPAASAGNNACSTRRVGGDQSGSASRKAWRRSKRKQPAKVKTATASQKPTKAGGDLIPANQPINAANVPRLPDSNISGANARRSISSTKLPSSGSSAIASSQPPP